MIILYVYSMRPGVGGTVVVKTEPSTYPLTNGSVGGAMVVKTEPSTYPLTSGSSVPSDSHYDTVKVR